MLSHLRRKVRKFELDFCVEVMTSSNQSKPDKCEADRTIIITNSCIGKPGIKGQRWSYARASDNKRLKLFKSLASAFKF